MNYRRHVYLPGVLILLLSSFFISTVYSETSPIVIEHVQLPTPPNMRILTNPPPKSVANMFTSPSNNLERLGNYVTEWDADALLLGMKPNMERCCLLELDKETLHKKMTVTHFRLFNTTLLETISETKSPVNIRKANKNLGYGNPKEIPEVKSLKIQYLGVDAEGENYLVFSTKGTIQGSWQANSEKIIQIQTNGVILLNGCYFVLSAISKYHDESDLMWARKTAINWIKRTNMLNKALPVAPEDFDLVTTTIAVLVFMLILLYFLKLSKKKKV